MNAQATTPLAVLGAGSWGTALAILLARNGRPVTLWGRDAVHLAVLARQRSNERYLPGIPFPELLSPVADMTVAVREAGDILLAVPSHAFRATVAMLRPYGAPGLMRVAWATKGLEPGSQKLLHEVVAEELGAVPTAVISGPTFAREVALGLPTAVTVASKDGALARAWAHYLHSPTFRAYTSEDVVGVEVGGATKNVLAIAAGIVDGLGFGANARAALIARGLAELIRLGEALGARRETLMGLAGLGDLVLTCTDDQSRNRRLGLALGRGQELQSAVNAIGQVVEGVQTAQEIHRLAQRLGVEMPIAEQVFRVLYEGRSPREAVQALLDREQKPEAI